MIITYDQNIDPARPSAWTATASDTVSGAIAARAIAADLVAEFVANYGARTFGGVAEVKKDRASGRLYADGIAGAELYVAWRVE